MKKKITIAIDAMGGDNSPDKTIQGVCLFLKKYKSNNDFFLNLYGDKNFLLKLFIQMLLYLMKKLLYLLSKILKTQVCGIV